MGFGFIQDLRFGLRILARSPGFALVAIVTLGLGIGANSTVFTLVNGVFFSGLPFSDPAEIVRLRQRVPPGFDTGFSWPGYLDYRAQARSFRDLGAYSTPSFDLSGDASLPERIPGARITLNTFPLLGQQVALGRALGEDDFPDDAPPVALISHGLWQTRYGGADDIIGRTVRVTAGERTSFRTIVGVMPEGEGFPNGTAMWIPLRPDAQEQERSARSFSVFGRLDDGVTLEEANVEARTIAASLAAAWPETHQDVGANVVLFNDLGDEEEVVAVFTALQGAVTFVLLIACANIANLLLSRAVGRTRETSIRAALGAGRGRIVRQLLIESLTMGLLGGALGLALTVFGVRTFRRAIAETGPPYWLTFPIDYTVLGYFFIVCVVSSLLFGLAPALHISRAEVNDHLREGGRGSSGSRRARRLTGLLITSQIAMTLVLLVGASLMIRSFLNTQRSDVGFDPKALLAARVTLGPLRYPGVEDQVRFADRVTEGIEQLPGIDGMTLATFAPGNGAGFRSLRLEDAATDGGARPSGPDSGLQAGTVVVAPGYFSSLGIRMLAGREFDATDGEAGREVAVVNAPFADQYWPGLDPVGRRIRLGVPFGAGVDADSPWLEVIGVSEGVLQSSSDEDTSIQPTVYVPFAQEPSAGFWIVVRSRVAPAALSGTIREELSLLDPELPLYDIQTVESMLRERNWPYRVFGTLFAVFALVALVLSSVGIYGVTAYGVSRRTSEIGICMALGARRKDVLALVLRQGLIRLAIGLAVGLFLAWGVSRILNAVLINVSATDPLTFTLIPLILAGVALAAAWIPARRALALDPADALRIE
jgi:putative ABC transport system permease protein